MSPRLLIISAIAAAALVPAALADDLAPGLWEITLAAKVEAAPGFEPGPFTVNQCFTKKDAQDPSKILGPLATPGASDCTYSKATYSGSTFHFSMQCAGALSMKTTGDLTFTPNKLNGTLKTSSTIDGKNVEFTSTLSARRTGDC